MLLYSCGLEFNLPKEVIKKNSPVRLREKEMKKQPHQEVIVDL